MFHWDVYIGFMIESVHPEYENYNDRAKPWLLHLTYDCFLHLANNHRFLVAPLSAFPSRTLDDI